MTGQEFDGRKAPCGDRWGSDDSGTSIPEFALVLPLLLIMLFGIVEFGIAFNRAQAVEAAAREGARLASLSTTTADQIDARVNDALAGIPFANPVVVDPTPNVVRPCEGRQGDPVTVEVTVEHPVNIPLVFSNTVTLTGQAVFRCEA